MAILAGRYELERRLGGGGMAEVFLARLVGKDGFSRHVAIKRVLAHLATDEAFAKMFVAEAQICAKLQHPNIVSVLDFDRDDEGRPFLVIELVDGPSLAELAEGGALPVGAAVHLATELLRGLAYAHELPYGASSATSAGGEGVRGIVHRDISPHNVLLSWEGAVKLSDFGIAKARDASGVTASELLKGKPAYMSPEQANGEPLDGRSDLFSVGIMLWELLVGRALFSGHTTQETLARVLFAPVPSARSIRAEIPEDVDAVVMKLLARDTKERYADADAAIAALVACKDHPRDGREKLVALLADRFAENAPQRKRMLADVPTVRTPAEYAPTLPSPRDATRSRNRPWLLVLGAVTLTSVAVAVTVVALGGREPRDSPAPVVPVVATPDAPALAVADATTIDAEAIAMTSDASVDASRDAAPVDPERALRASARAKVLEQMLASNGQAPFSLPTPKAVVPEELHARGRREAQRLFGKVYEGWVDWDGIRADGTVDTTTHRLWMNFVAATPEDDRVCLVITAQGGKAPLKLKVDPCERSPGIRCTARELHRRAVELGLPESATVHAGLGPPGWMLLNKDARLSTYTKNDCKDGAGKTPNEADLVAERAKIVTAGKGRGDVPFLVPDETSVDPTKFFDDARREVRRLFGTSGTVSNVTYAGFGSDGRIDGTKMGHHVTVVFVVPTTSDGFNCVQFSSNYGNRDGRFRMMLVKSEAFCRSLANGASQMPRCTTVQLFQRAVEKGMKPTDKAEARLEASVWRLTGEAFETKSPNDCR